MEYKEKTIETLFDIVFLSSKLCLIQDKDISHSNIVVVFANEEKERQYLYVTKTEFFIEEIQDFLKNGFEPIAVIMFDDDENLSIKKIMYFREDNIEDEAIIESILESNLGVILS